MQRFLLGGVSLAAILIAGSALAIVGGEGGDSYPSNPNTPAERGYVCEEAISYQTCVKGNYRHKIGQTPDYNAGTSQGYLIYGCSPCPEGYDDAEGAQSEYQCALVTTAGKYVATEGEGEVDCISPYYCPGNQKITYGTTGGNQSCKDFLEGALGDFYPDNPYTLSEDITVGSNGGAADTRSCFVEFTGGKYIGPNSETENFDLMSCDNGYVHPAEQYYIDNGSEWLDYLTSCSACGAGKISNAGLTQCESCPALPYDVTTYEVQDGQTDYGAGTCAIGVNKIDITGGSVTGIQCHFDYGVRGYQCGALRQSATLSCDGGKILDGVGTNVTFEGGTDGYLWVQDLSALACSPTPAGTYSPDGAYEATQCAGKVENGVQRGAYCVGGKAAPDYCPQAVNVVGSAIVYGLTNPTVGATSLTQCYLPPSSDILYNNPGVGTYNIIEVCPHVPTTAE